MGKNLLIKITIGKPPNEMGNCPFASPLVTPLNARAFLLKPDLEIRPNLPLSFALITISRCKKN